MDYHESSAGDARLAVAKYAATSSEKLGTIFFIPGTPFNPSPASVLPSNPRLLQVDRAVQESEPRQNTDHCSVKLFRAALTSYPGILVELETQRLSIF